jgi:hypothetical protein
MLDVRATAEEAETEKVCQSNHSKIDGHQVIKEGRHGSMIIQQGGILHMNNSGMDIITVCLTKQSGDLK